MDKVALEDRSDLVAQYDLDGPLLEDTLTTFGLALPAIEEVQSSDIDGVAIKIVGKRGLSGVGARLIIPRDAATKVEGALRGAGMVHASQDVYETCRIEAGLPGINELTEEFTPLEVGLGQMISDSKGCYTGQEIIARQITYDKVTRLMVGLRLASPVQVGATVAIDSRSIGVVTSVTDSPRLGCIALAVLKRSHQEAGIKVSIDGTAGIIASLPFTK